MASSSATTGRESRKARTVRDVRRSLRPRVNSSLSACTATGSSRRAASRSPSSRVTSSTRGNSGRPESHMNALNPTTPRAAISAMSDTEPGTSPPHSAKSVMDEASSAARLRSNSRAFDGARRGVQRHVEEQRAAAGRKRPAAGGSALPLGAPRLVEVQVHVDDAGEHQEPVRVNLFPAAVSVDRHLGDRAIIDRQISRAESARRDERSPTDHDVAHVCAPARSSRNASPVPSAAATSSSMTASSG